MTRRRHLPVRASTWFAALFLGMALNVPIQAQDQSIDLTGTWNWTPEGLETTTLVVPGFYVWKALIENTAYFDFDETVEGPWAVVEGISESTYERTFDVPASMAGKRLYLHFEAANFLARIKVNDEHIMDHVGGFLPFDVDITDYVSAPSTGNTLTVEILYYDTRFMESEDYPLWPNGFYGLYWYLGITGDVSLVARNAVQIKDIWVRTSVSAHTLTVTAEVTNQGVEAQTVTLAGSVESGPALSSRSQSIAAGETVTITWTQSWSSAELWWPDSPRLYTLTLQASVGGTVQHSRSQRFGFRETGVSGRKFLLNGQPWRLMGDSFVLHSEKRYLKYGIMTSENLPDILDSMQALNINVLRFHQEPPPPWMLDLCDEKGMLIIAESAIYEKVAPRNEKFVTNAQGWLAQWVKRDRNHPCIVAWSAENEMKLLGQKFYDSQIITWGASVRAVDPDRPVYYEGDGDFSGNGDFYSIHYLYGFPNGDWPTASIYTDMASKVPSDRPISHGEFEWSRREIPESDRVRRQCVKTRVSRVLDWADIRPYRLDWAWHPHPDFTTEDYNGWKPTAEEIDFLKATLSLVAVYDRGYYEYHYDPSPPFGLEDQTMTRTLVTLNDGRSSSPITVRWRVLLGERVKETGEYSQTVAPGQQAEHALTFTAPIVPGDTEFQLEITAWQDETQVFQETVTYLSKENGVTIPAPPLAVAGLSGTRQGTGLSLSWSPVLKTEMNEDADIAQYRIFRSTSPEFPEGGTDSLDVDGSQLTYIDSDLGTFNDPTVQHYYRWRAIDHYDQHSPLSEILGVVQYQLNTSSTTDFNAVALPVSGLWTTAAQWVQQLTFATSLAQWVGASQGFVQYTPTLSFTDFAVSANQAYYINVTRDTLLTLVGTVSSGQYQLTRTQPTAFHTLMVPLDRSDLTLASALATSIGSCNAVSRWNTPTQSHVQYVPSVPATDFTIRPGMALMVHVTADVTWPQESAFKTVVLPELAAATGPTLGLPHAVWGRWPMDCDPLPAHFSAVLSRDPQNSLTEQSAGSLIDGQNWLVQTSAFPSGWSVGDTLVVRFMDEAGALLGQSQAVLDSEPAQEAVFIAEGKEEIRPESFSLSSAYPNPFNGGTHVVLSLPEQASVLLRVYNLRGACVRSRRLGEMSVGQHVLDWDGRDDEGTPVPSGAYFIEVDALGKRRVEKVVLSQ